MTDKPLALITGGAQGIGYSCAQALAQDGFCITLAHVKADGGANVGRPGGRVCDMRDPAAVEPIFDQIAAEFGTVWAFNWASTMCE